MTIEGTPIPEIPIADESDMDEGDLELEQFTAGWTELFKVLGQVAKRKPEDCDELGFEGDIEDLRTDNPFLLRVNAPFINPDFQPKIVTLDIYKNQIHTQRALAMAEWKDGDPKVTDLSNIPLEYSLGFFDNDQLVQHAIFLITTAIEDTGAIFPIPQEYGDQIH